MPTFKEYEAVSVMSWFMPMLCLTVLLCAEEHVATKEAVEWTVNVWPHMYIASGEMYKVQINYCT